MPSLRTHYRSLAGRPRARPPDPAPPPPPPGAPPIRACPNPPVPLHRHRRRRAPLRRRPRRRIADDAEAFRASVDAGARSSSPGSSPLRLLPPRPLAPPRRPPPHPRAPSPAVSSPSPAELPLPPRPLPPPRRPLTPPHRLPSGTPSRSATSSTRHPPPAARRPPPAPDVARAAPTPRPQLPSPPALQIHQLRRHLLLWWPEPNLWWPAVSFLDGGSKPPGRADATDGERSARRYIWLQKGDDGESPILEAQLGRPLETVFCLCSPNSRIGSHMGRPLELLLEVGFFGGFAPTESTATASSPRFAVGLVVAECRCLCRVLQSYFWVHLNFYCLLSMLPLQVLFFVIKEKFHYQRSEV